MNQPIPNKPIINMCFFDFRKLLVLVFSLLAINLSAQNMQLGDVYLTYNPSRTAIVPLDEKMDLIATSWSQGDMFFPDHQDFNFSVANSNDAFVVWQEAQNHRYVKHIQISGDSTQNIERIWVSDDQDIFIILSSSNADTLTISNQTSVQKIQQPQLGNQGLAYFLIKLDKDGSFQGHVFLGYFGNTTLEFLYPNHIYKSIPIRMYYSDSVNILPGTTTKLISQTSQVKTVSFEINCKTLKTENVVFVDWITERTPRFWGNNYTNQVECRYVSKSNPISVPDSIGCIIRFGENYADSMLASRNISFGSNASINDTLYLSHTSTDEQKHTINAIDFRPNVRYISKWISGVLKDSMVNSLHQADFFVDRSNRLYHYGYGSSPDLQVSIKFLKGDPYLLKDDHVFRFWGPINNDSLEWLTNIAGNLGLGVGYYFYADSNAQYFQSNVKSWMDLDPGPYEWQFSPTTYNNKSVIAKYNCYPNAIFTFDQTGQKVQFYNFSSGGKSYKWFFGVGTVNSTELNPVFKYPAVGDYDVTLIAYNDCGADTFVFPVNVEKMISVKEQTSLQANIYPNPSNSEVSIVHNLNNARLQILDLSGKLVHVQPLANQKCTLNVSHLQPGVYFVLLKSEGKVVVRKLEIYQ